MKIEQALIDPRWEVGTVTIGGVVHPLITLEHPAHGLIHSIITKETATELASLLAKIGEPAQ